MPTRGASTLLLLDCTAHVNSIYHQGVKIPKHFWVPLLTKGTYHPNQLRKQKYKCGSCDTNFLQYEYFCSSVFSLGSQNTILFPLYEMLLKTQTCQVKRNGTIHQPNLRTLLETFTFRHITQASLIWKGGKQALSG